MKPKIYEEANKIWFRFSKDAQDTELTLPFTVHKKLLSLFHVGEFYYYIFNVKNSEFEMVSSEISQVLGYDHQLIDVSYFLGKIHPEDQSYFLNFENAVTEFFLSLRSEQIENYKVSYDYRVLRKDGTYVRILQQVFTIQSDGKTVLKTFGIHTDISHLKPSGIPVLSFIGLNGEPSYINVNVKNIYSSTSVSLSHREKEVLRLLVEGKSSEQISKELFISKFTVDTHRKNLLRKTECINTASLISMVMQKGWL